MLHETLKSGAVAVLMAICGVACFAGDGLRLVEAKLAAPPNRHLATEKNAIVFNGVASAKFDPAKDAPRMMAIRSQLLAEAMIAARKSLARYVSQNFSVWEGVVDASSADSSLWISGSESKGSSDIVLDGCTVSDYAELVDDGDFFVAVTLEWSVEGDLAAKVAKTGRKFLDEADFTRLRAHLKGAELSRKIGPRICEITHGGQRLVVPVGTAAIDIDGLSGLQLKKAIRKVEIAAGQAFEQAVETPVHVDFSDSSVVEKSCEGEEESVQSESRLTTVTESVSRNMNHVKRRMAYSGVLVDGATRRKLYVMSFVPDCFAENRASSDDNDGGDF